MISTIDPKPPLRHQPHALAVAASFPFRAKPHERPSGVAPDFHVGPRPTSGALRMRNPSSRITKSLFVRDNNEGK